MFYTGPATSFPGKHTGFRNVVNPGGLWSIVSAASNVATVMQFSTSVKWEVDARLKSLGLHNTSHCHTDNSPQCVRGLHCARLICGLGCPSPARAALYLTLSMWWRPSEQSQDVQRTAQACTFLAVQCPTT